MLRRTALALAASLWLAAAGAQAAVTDITDGTSNTILLPERQLGTQVDLAGTGKLRVGEVVRRGPFPAALVFDAESETFSLLVDEELFLTGHLVAKGTQGDRFRLFLDSPSRDLFTSHLASLASTTDSMTSGYSVPCTRNGPPRGRPAPPRRPG